MSSIYVVIDFIIDPRFEREYRVSSSGRQVSLAASLSFALFCSTECELNKNTQRKRAPHRMRVFSEEMRYKGVRVFGLVSYVPLL